MKREFSRKLALKAVGPTGRIERLEANQAEREALAERLGIIALDSLTAEIALSPAPGGALRARGTIRAEVVQACVVTLDPVPELVEEVLDWRILPAGEAASDDLDEGPDEIESEPDGSVDLGEALAQELSLSLDPYPRAPGAELPDEARAAAENPFAAMRSIKKN
jgi:uncharacterized metal-binding protein YceD (DUF177 family)